MNASLWAGWPPIFVRLLMGRRWLLQAAQTWQDTATYQLYLRDDVAARYHEVRLDFKPVDREWFETRAAESLAAAAIDRECANCKFFSRAAWRRL